MSYHYIKRRGKSTITPRFAHLADHSVLIDSGGYTFLTDDEYQGKDIAFWENFIEGYISFINEYKDKISACVEMDLDKLVGTSVVNEWREKYFHNLDVPVIYVYHKDKGIQEWERMCATYSYVGFSFNEIDDIDTIDKLFKIAIKNKTKVHVFATTGNTVLTQFPAYSSDASSWLSGSQFGELNYFENGGVHRLKKDKWKQEYIPRLVALGCSKELLLAEAPYELMRASALSYMKLQEFIRNKFKARRYWEKRDSLTIEEKLPPQMWFVESDKSDWRDWAEKMNIDTRVSDDVGIGLINDMFNFVTDNAVIEDYSLKELIELCKLFNDKEANTKTKCVVRLKQYFTDALNGTNTSLMAISAPPEGGAKEREEYVEVEKFEEKEVSKEECESILKGLLTDGVTDSADKALIENGITPIYDEQGNIKAGLKKLRKRKNLYAKLGHLTCDQCYQSSNCPQYKAGYVCAYEKMFQQFDTRDINDVDDAMASIVDLAMERLTRAVLFERMDGNITDAVSKQMQQAYTMAKDLADFRDKRGTIVAERKTVVNPNGSTEVREAITANPVKNGLLGNILGNK